MNFFVRLALWTAVFFFTSCSPAELDGPLAAVRVFGRVTTRTGTPVPGAPVALAWRPSNTCDQEVFTIAFDTTDTQGHYAATVGEFGSRFVACIRVIAEPPPQSSLLPDTVFSAGVIMEASAFEDSLAVNLVLRPSGT